MFLQLGLLLTLATGTEYWQSTDQTITYHCVATRIKNLLPDLSKATGLNIESDRKLLNEVLVIDVKDVKLKELMDRIASCAGARWTKEKDRYLLERPSELEIELKKKEKEDTEKWLQVQIDKQKARYSVGIDLTERGVAESVQKMVDQAEKLKHIESDIDWDDFARIDGELRKSLPLPDQELLFNLISSLGVKTLSSIRPNSRVVFSTSPNILQTRFVADLACLKRYSSIRDMVSRALARMPDPDVRRDIAETYNLPHDDAEEPLSKILLVVDREYDGSIYMVNMYVIGTKGNEIGRAAAVLIYEPTLPPTMPANSKPVEWSPLTSSLFAALANDKPRWDKLDSSLQKYVIQPEEQDILSAAPTDIVISIARSKGRNLVAAIPDRLENLNEPTRCNNLTIGKAELSLLGEFRLKVEDDGVWYTISPISPISAAAERFDREAIGKYLRIYSKKRNATLTESAAAVSGISNANETSAMRHLFGVMRMTGWQYVCLPPMHWEGLKLLAFLPIPQQQALMSGQTLSDSAFTPAIRSILFDSVFGCRGHVGIKKAVPCYEATELLRNGIPLDTSIRLEIQNDIMVAKVTDDGEEESLTIAGLAQLIHSNQTPTALYLSYMTTYRLYVKFTPLCENSYNIGIAMVDRSNRLTEKSLPADLMIQLNSALVRLQSQK